MTIENPKLVFSLLMFGIALWLLYCIKRLSAKRKLETFESSPEIATIFQDTPWYLNLNLGALMFSFFWLVANGFWGWSVIYLILGSIFWPAAILLSIILFLIGNQVSWKNGQRWGNNYEEFASMQDFWNSLGVVVLIISGFITLLIKVGL